MSPVLRTDQMKFIGHFLGEDGKAIFKMVISTSSKWFLDMNTTWKNRAESHAGT